jgi:hypothetical protein
LRFVAGILAYFVGSTMALAIGYSLIIGRRVNAENADAIAPLLLSAGLLYAGARWIQGKGIRRRRSMPDQAAAPRPRRMRAAIAFVATTLAAVGVIFLADRAIARRKNLSIDRVLVQAVLEMNQRMPMTVDEVTRMDSVTAAPGRNIYYKGSLFRTSKDELDIEAFKGAQTKLLIDAYRSDKLAFFRGMGVTMHYRYYDKEGVFLTEIVVGPGDLN